MDTVSNNMVINNSTVGTNSRADTVPVVVIIKPHTGKRHHTNNNRQRRSSRCMVAVVEHPNNSSLQQGNGNQQRPRTVKCIITTKGLEKLNGINRWECLKRNQENEGEVWRCVSAFVCFFCLYTLFGCQFLQMISSQNLWEIYFDDLSSVVGFGL